MKPEIEVIEMRKSVWAKYMFFDLFTDTQRPVSLGEAFQDVQNRLTEKDEKSGKYKCITRVQSSYVANLTFEAFTNTK